MSYVVSGFSRTVRLEADTTYNPNMHRFSYLVLLLAIGCGAPPPSAPKPALQTVTLPDISSAAPPVQKQLRDQYTALQQNASSADAYGAMGRLLIATEFYDAAAICFADAQMLQPAEMQWP